MATCSCGARIPENAAWCPVCFKKPVDPERLLDEMNDAFRKTTWSPPAVLVAPSPPPVHSRWRAGPRSFGPGLKIGLTAAFVAFTIAAAVLDPLSAAPIGAVSALVLRATWRRERIR